MDRMSFRQYSIDIIPHSRGCDKDQKGASLTGGLAEQMLCAADGQ